MAKPIVVKILGDAKGALDAFGEVEGRAGMFATVGVAAVGAFAVGAGAALFKVGSDFDDMKNTIIKGTGASGEALDGLFESTKGVMSGVPDSGALVATVIADVNTFFGATGDELETLSEGVLDFARLTGVDASDAVDRLHGVMTTFNMTTGEADELMGDLVRISQATGVSMDELTSQVDKWGPSFAEAGLSAEEAAAMVGKFNQAGLDVDAAGKSFNKFLLDAAGNGLNAEEAMAGLDERMATLSGPERLAEMEGIFGAKNAQAALQAYESGALALDDFNGLLGEGAGVVAEQTAATETFADKWNQFKNKVLVRLEPLATRLFEAISKGMDWINDKGIPAVEGMVAKFETFSDWVRQNKDYILGGLAAVAGLIVVTLGPAFVVWAATAAAAALATIAAMLPVIAIVVAIAALGAAIVWLWKNWDKAWDKIKEIASAAWEFITTKVGEAWEWIKTKSRQAFDWIIGKVTGFKDSAVAKFVELKDAAAAKVSELADSVVGFIRDMPGRIRSAASGMFDGIKEAFRSALNWIIRKWNSLEFTIGGGSFMGVNIPEATFGTPKIREFHSGGVVPGRYGEEVFAILQAGETVRTREQEAALGGFHIENLYVTERNMLDEFVELEARYGMLV